MDIRKVKKLIELLEESGISELEISEGENRAHQPHPRMAMQAPMAMAKPHRDSVRRSPRPCRGHRPRMAGADRAPVMKRWCLPSPSAPAWPSADGG